MPTVTEEPVLLITQKMKLKDAINLSSLDEEVQQDLKDLGVTEESEYVRKGMTIKPEDLEFVEGERAVIARITSYAKDRDNERVNPKGGIFRDFEKNPVVLFGHNYWDLPVGRCMWIKSDENGLIAKTEYAKHEKAEEIYQYRKDGFPMAQSIGFIPIETKYYDDGTPERQQGIRREYVKWVLLEYSDVPVPSNPEAVTIAVSKGITGWDEARELMVKDYIVNDADDTEDVSKGKQESDDISNLEPVTLNTDTIDLEEKLANLKDELLTELKAGKVLSKKNRATIKTAVTAMNSAVQALNELLKATEETTEEETENEESEEEVEDSKSVLGLYIKEPEQPQTVEKFSIDRKLIKEVLVEEGLAVLLPAIRRGIQDTIKIQRGQV